jgi:hypothetical protein
MALSDQDYIPLAERKNWKEISDLKSDLSGRLRPAAEEEKERLLLADIWRSRHSDQSDCCREPLQLLPGGWKGQETDMRLSAGAAGIHRFSRGDGSCIVFLKSGAGADDVPPGDLSFPDHMEEIVTEGDPFSRLIRLPDEAEKKLKELPGRREYMRSMYEMELDMMKEKAYKEGYEEGYKEGLKLALIEMVKSRIRKGLDPETAAKQLMREEEVIRPIYDMILAMPEASEQEILDALEKQEAQK